MTGASSWSQHTDWGSNSPVSTWKGVDVGAAGRVVGLDLCNNALSGEVRALCGLPHLEAVRLAGNPTLCGGVAALTTLHRLTTLWVWGTALRSDTDVTCLRPAVDRNALEKFYEATGGS